MAKRVPADAIKKDHQLKILKYLHITPKKLSTNPTAPEPVARAR